VWASIDNAVFESAIAVSREGNRSATGTPPDGVLPSRNVIVPVGLVNGCAGLTEPVFAWTVAVSPTDPPALKAGGLAVTVVVALFCPSATEERLIGTISRAE
jgi:hypothetical protein